MANQINARFLLKYDSYQNWTDLNPVLLAGEVAIATIPAVEGNTTQPVTGNTLPQVLIKVGDGTSHYTTLPFASALAADVHPWAKESQTEFETRVGNLVKNLSYTKAEVYNKTEIDAFLALYYKKTEVDAITGALADLNTTNKSSLVGAINEALQAVEVGGTGSVVSVIKEETPTEGSQATYKVTQGGNAVGVKIEIPVGYDETALAGRVQELENKSSDYVEKEEGKSLISDTEIERLASVDNYDDAWLGDHETWKESMENPVNGLSEAVADVATRLGKISTIANSYANGFQLGPVQSATEAIANLNTTVKAEFNTVNEGLTNSKVTIDEDTSDSSVAKTYIFRQGVEEIGRIKLAKDLVVTAGSVKEVQTMDVPYMGAEVGDKYIELVIANQTEPIYVPAKDLVDIYKAQQGAAEVQIAINGENEISATLVNGGVTEAKLAEDVKTKLNKTWEEVGVAQGLVDALANGQVKTNKEAIDAINNAETGLLAQAATDATNKANAAQAAAEAKAATAQAAAEAAQTTANEAKAAAGTNATAITALQEKDTALETEIGKKANDADLKEIAKTGSIYDVTEGANVSTGTDGVEYLIFYAGTASTII